MNNNSVQECKDRLHRREDCRAVQWRLNGSLAHG